MANQIDALEEVEFIKAEAWLSAWLRFIWLNLVNPWVVFRLALFGAWRLHQTSAIEPQHDLAPPLPPRVACLTLSVLVGVILAFIWSQKFKSVEAAGEFVTTSVALAGVEGVALWTLPIFFLALTIGACLDLAFQRLSTAIVPQPPVSCLSWLSVYLFVHLVGLTYFAIQLVRTESGLEILRTGAFLLSRDSGYVYEPPTLNLWPSLAILALSIIWGYRRIIVMPDDPKRNWRAQLRRVLGGLVGLVGTFGFVAGSEAIASKAWQMRTHFTQHMPTIGATTCDSRSDTANIECTVILHGGSRTTVIQTNSIEIRLHRRDEDNAGPALKSLGVLDSSIVVSSEAPRSEIILMKGGDLGLRIALKKESMCALFFKGMTPQERAIYGGHGPGVSLAYEGYLSGMPETGDRFHGRETEVVELSEGRSSLQVNDFCN